MRRNQGITLIALVITIIVLLILAGITIASLSGENGILTRAKEARDETEIATIEEQIELAKISSLDDNGEIVKQTLKKELGKIEGIDNIIDKVNGVQVEYKGKSQFIPTGNGKIELGEDELEDIADGIIEDQGEQDYIIGIDVYGNQVDLANWNCIHSEEYGGFFENYIGNIENGTIIGEIPAYIIKSEGGVVTKAPVIGLESAFMNKTDLKTINVAFPKTVKYYAGAFINSGITSIPPKINVDKAQSLAGIFMNCTGLTEIPQSFNLANASNLQICAKMFEGCTNLATIPEGFGLPASVTTTEKMFYNTKITEIPQSLSLANVTSLKNCENMFADCTELTTIPEGFALPTSLINTQYMFRNTKITKIPQSLNLANLSKLSHASWMFAGCTELTEIPEGFALPSSISYAQAMFHSTKIKEIPESFNLVNTSLKSCVEMFSGCTELTTIPEGFALPQTVTDASFLFKKTGIKTVPQSFNLVNLPNLKNCGKMFTESSIETLPNNFALSNSIIDCSGMFSLCRSLQSVPDTFILGDNMEKCESLFECCEKLEHISSKFTIPPKITNIGNMFLQVKYAYFDNLIIPEGVTSMHMTFTSAGLQGQITLHGNPTEYTQVFKYTAQNCEQPVTVNYTSKCTNIEAMKATMEFSKIEFKLIQ